MQRVVPVFFDFVCPWSYAARAREQRWQRELNVQFTYVPWELSPRTPPEGRWNPHVEPTERLLAFARSSGRRLHGASRVYNTRRALRGLFYAKAVGAEEAYVDRAFEAFWEEHANLHDEQVLRRVARESGMEEDAFVRAALDDSWDAHLRAADAWSDCIEVQTTVTYVLDGRAVQALDPPDVVRARLEAVAQRA